jgi:hypothetical protein
MIEKIAADIATFKEIGKAKTDRNAILLVKKILGC